MAERYLIINADDFGNSKGTNKAIAQLFKEKRITSSTIMAPATEADDALSIAKNGSYAVGVHLTINSDWDEHRWQSVLPKQDVASLSDEYGLYHDRKKLSKSARSSHIDLELDAQVKYMIDRGCKPDHADNHCGTLYGLDGRLFFFNVFRLCRKYDLPFRFPKGTSYLEDMFPSKIPKYVMAAQAFVASIAKMMKVPILDDMITNQSSINDIDSYETLKDFYLRKVANIKEGITELFLHPSYEDEKMKKITGEWTKREMELKFLLSDDLFKLIDKEDIKLVSWAEAPFKC